MTRPGFEMSEQVAANNGFSVLTWKRKSLGFLNIIDYGVSQNSCFLLFVFVFKLDFWRYGVEVPGRLCVLGGRACVGEDAGRRVGHTLLRSLHCMALAPRAWGSGSHALSWAGAPYTERGPSSGSGLWCGGTDGGAHGSRRERSASPTGGCFVAGAAGISGEKNGTGDQSLS